MEENKLISVDSVFQLVSCVVVGRSVGVDSFMKL